MLKKMVYPISTVLHRFLVEIVVGRRKNSENHERARVESWFSVTQLTDQVFKKKVVWNAARLAPLASSKVSSLPLLPRASLIQLESSSFLPARALRGRLRPILGRFQMDKLDAPSSLKMKRLEQQNVGIKETLVKYVVFLNYH